MNYHNITFDDMLNGDGIRVVLWLSGCNHACPGCQNPVTWDPNDGLPFDKNVKEELFSALSKDHVSGITFSGGDPLHPKNRDDVEKLMQEIRDRFPNKTVWVYTGYLYEELISWTGLPLIDVLVDGPYIESQRDVNLMWKGSSNQRVIDIKKSIAAKQISLHCGNYKDNCDAIYSVLKCSQ